MIRAIFESMMGDDTPHFSRNRLDRIDFTGHSYLLKPENLLWVFQNDNQVDAANYLMVASYRNYAEYEVTGDFTLPLSHSPVPTDKIQKNSLLRLEGMKIHFLLEN